MTLLRLARRSRTITTADYTARGREERDVNRVFYIKREYTGYVVAPGGRPGSRYVRGARRRVAPVRKIAVKSAPIGHGTASILARHFADGREYHSARLRIYETRRTKTTTNSENSWFGALLKP